MIFAAALGCNAIDGADGYKRVGSEAGGDSDGICATSCLAASRGCLDNCDATHTSCVSACGLKQGCINQCDNTQTSCRNGCVSTCTGCDPDCTLSECQNPPAADAGADAAID